MRTSLCDKLNIDVPVIQAAMGGADGPALAAAVSNAGGLGMLALWRADANTLRQQIHETRSLTPRPFGVNLNLEWRQEERLIVCLEEGGLGGIWGVDRDALPCEQGGRHSSALPGSSIARD